MSEYRYCLRGDIDIDNASQLRADLKLALAHGKHLLIDCTALRFIDSSGIAVLLEAHAQLEADGRHMLIQNVKKGPRLALEALGLTDLLRYEREASPEGAW
jgi:anti-sigma B factor antagonist